MAKRPKSPRYSDEHKAEVVAQLRAGVPPRDIKHKGSVTAFLKWLDEANRRDGITSIRAERPAYLKDKRDECIAAYATGLTAEQVSAKFGGKPSGQAILKWIKRYAPEHQRWRRRQKPNAAEFERMRLELEQSRKREGAIQPDDVRQLKDRNGKLEAENRRKDTELQQRDAEIRRLTTEVSQSRALSAQLEQVRKLVLGMTQDGPGSPGTCTP